MIHLYSFYCAFWFRFLLTLCSTFYISDLKFFSSSSETERAYYFGLTTFFLFSD